MIRDLDIAKIKRLMDLCKVDIIVGGENCFFITIDNVIEILENLKE